jgi:hypothetical protein
MKDYMSDFGLQVKGASGFGVGLKVDGLGYMMDATKFSTEGLNKFIQDVRDGKLSGKAMVC